MQVQRRERVHYPDTRVVDALRVEVKGCHLAAASRRGRRPGETPLSISRERQTCADVLARKIGKISDDRRFGHAAGEIVQHVVDRDTQSSDARLAATLPRLDRNAILVIHSRRILAERSWLHGPASCIGRPIGLAHGILWRLVSSTHRTLLDFSLLPRLCCPSCSSASFLTHLSSLLTSCFPLPRAVYYLRTIQPATGRSRPGRSLCLRHLWKTFD